jgi:hypothetical protein
MFERTIIIKEYIVTLVSTVNCPDIDITKQQSRLMKTSFLIQAQGLIFLLVEKTPSHSYEKPFALERRAEPVAENERTPEEGEEIEISSAASLIKLLIFARANARKTWDLPCR